ncbi:hypothetical protein AXF42_Ash015041 [Apostasia shenzhenica]|uniref:Uncharacterized protein n=1 Tax=Apostasia shenzhenica TaxID=1088818 RepID=A0A2I0B2Y7_9ASPA|nr:hypothetical protein AXF42_Ash015041 [Apostasia shenzhenica]
MDLQICHCPENITKNFTTIEIIKCVTKAPILAKFLAFHLQQRSGKKGRVAQLVEQLPADQRPKRFNTNSIIFIWTIII